MDWSASAGESNLRRRWPTAMDHMIRYNAGIRNGQEIHEEIYGEWPEGDPYEYFDSIPDVPPIEYGGAVKEAAFQSMCRYFASNGSSRYDEFGEVVLRGVDDFKTRGELAGVTGDWDRTMETPVVLVSIVTPAYVRNIQQTFLREYPLWRLELVGSRQYGEESIMIYPEVVCVGEKQCPPAILESAVQEWRRRTMLIRDRGTGCQTRQQRLVVRRLPALMAEARNVDARLIAIFDNFRGDFDVYNIWVAQRGLDDEIQTPLDPVVASTVDFHCDAEGRRCKVKKDRIYFAVKQYTVPKTSGIAKLPLQRTSDERSWEFDIQGSEVVSDELLRSDASQMGESCSEPALLSISEARAQGMEC